MRSLPFMANLNIGFRKDLSQNDKFCGRSLFMAGRELKQLECGKVSVFVDSKADPVTKTGSNVDHILFAISYAI